jgi:hypothetical protein
MAVKKPVAVKKVVPAKKAAPAKPAAKTAAKVTGKKVAKGAALECVVCGLAVTVNEACGCVDYCDIVCCGKPMKAKTAATAAPARRGCRTR